MQHTGVGSTNEEAATDRLIFNGLRELAGDEAPDFLPTLVGHFLEDVPLSIEQMRQAIGRNELARVAHRLKGGAANLGALGMVQLGEQISVAGGGHGARTSTHITG
ncbi:MAG TPA: Hpt domain-containing protein [Nitrospira sp.]|nr:Hpt domain-containing protein [Nitrospira sp.]